MATSERKSSESDAEVLEKKVKNMRDAATQKEKDELDKIEAMLKDAAKVRDEAEEQADEYQKNAMASPNAKNQRAEELLKSIKK